MKYLFGLLLCMSCFCGSAQTLELVQLQSIIDCPVTSITDSLVKNGWSLHPELSGIQANQLYSTFSFGNLKDQKNKALSWFRIHADDGLINQIYYQTPGKVHFDNLMAEIIKLGAEKKDLKNIDDTMVGTYYVTKDYVFESILGVDNYTLMVTKTPKQ
jgi:hypothetical protein